LLKHNNQGYDKLSRTKKENFLLPLGGVLPGVSLLPEQFSWQFASSATLIISFIAFAIGRKND
jgi:hypothetical protein